MFDRKFNINAIFDDGYFVANIFEQEANKILEDIESETWVYVKPDIQENSGMIEKDYKNRYVALSSILNPTKLPNSYKNYQDNFNKWASPMLKRFKTAKRVHLSALMGQKGYFMDMHSDVGDRCPFTVLLYLGKDFDNNPDLGGNLNIFSVDARNPGENPSLIEKIAPSHGKLVILNNLDPTIYHSVDMVKTEGKRYSILSSFGIDFIPDWDYQYKNDLNMSGQVLNPGSPVFIDDHETILKLIE